MSGSTGEPPDASDQPGAPGESERWISEIEAELHRPAKFKEPSAAERARKPGKVARLRNARQARKLRKPVPEPPSRPGFGQPPPRPGFGQPPPRPGFGQPPPPRPSRPSRPSRRGKVWSLLIAVVVIAGLSAAAVELPRLGLGKTPGRADNTPVTNGATPAGQPTTSGTPASYVPAPTLAAPFLGTPAQSYADGSAGIVVPPAQPVGAFSAAQVTAAYRTTKRLLVAAELNGPTLAGGAPDAFANLLIKEQRTQFVDGLDKIGRNAHGVQRSTRAWITSFAPGTTQLDGNVIKVHGSMQATTAEEDGFHVLRIQVNYLFVYAVMQPSVPSSLIRVVVHDLGNVNFAAFDDPGGPLEPLWQMGSSTAGVRCDVADGFVHPEFPNGPPDKVKPTGAPVNPYDQNAPVGSAQCGATTGT
jgi:hypothetical protein